MSKRSKSKLKGYRIRVVVDLPVWEFNSKAAKLIGEEIIRRAHSASVIMESKIIKEGPPDNKALFPEFQPPFNPSRRKN